MTSWIDRPVLCVDTETTGINCYEDRIVEVAAVGIDPTGQPLRPWSTIINPGIDIPAGAAAIHGITTERAQTEGIQPADALATLAGLVHDWCVGLTGFAPVVMFNARFDWPLIITEAERHGIDFPAFVPIVDPYVLDRLVDRYRKGSRQLGATAAHYDIPLGDEAHGALADATATGRILRKMLERHPDLGRQSLASLHVAQVKAQNDQREGFVDYRRRTSDPSFDIPVGWPIPVAS